MCHGLKLKIRLSQGRRRTTQTYPTTTDCDSLLSECQSCQLNANQALGRISVVSHLNYVSGFGRVTNDLEYGILLPDKVKTNPMLLPIQYL